MPKSYDIPGAAAFLSVPESTLKFWRAHGTGPTFCKIGKRITYCETDLLTYIESRRMTQSTRKAV